MGLATAVEMGGSSGRGRITPSACPIFRPRGSRPPRRHIPEHGKRRVPESEPFGEAGVALSDKSKPTSSSVRRPPGRPRQFRRPRRRRSQQRPGLPSFFLRGQVRGLFLENRWEQKLGFSYIGSRRDHENPVDSAHPSIRKRDVQRRPLEARLAEQRLSPCLEHADLRRGNRRGNRASPYTSLSRLGPYVSDFPRRKADTAGVYVQDQMRIAEQFYATVGVRLDHHSRAGTALTYRLAPAYFLAATQTKFKATLGTGFKSPSLYQLFAPGTFWGPIGNERLKPEESRGWDAGIDQYFLKGTVQARNLLFPQRFPQPHRFRFQPGLHQYRTGPDPWLRDFRRASDVENLRLRISYTRLEARNLDSGADLLRRPKDKFTAQADWTFLKKWTFDSRLFTRAGGRTRIFGLDHPRRHAARLLARGRLSFLRRFPERNCFCASTTCWTRDTKRSSAMGRRAFPSLGDSRSGCRNDITGAR